MKKILCIAPDTHGGVSKYRIISPYTYLALNYSKEFTVDITLDAKNDDNYFLNYDIVVFHDFIHKTYHEDNLKRIKWLKQKGIVTIMDIDDLWSVPNTHPSYNEIKHTKFAFKKIEMLKLVDYITTTTNIFKKTIKDKLNLKNVLVFPNGVDETDKQFQPNPTNSDKLRFGWLGGSTHLHDLNKLRDGINSILFEYHNDVQFVLCGFDTRGEIIEVMPDNTQRVRKLKPEESVWYKYEKIFTNNYQYIDLEYKNFLHNFVESSYDDVNKSYRRIWTKNINEYANNYNLFDVALAPIVENDFNYNKSQLKVIEAGFHKKACIATDFGPYSIDLKSSMENGIFNDKGNALLVPERKDHKLWGYYMKKLIQNPNMVTDLGERLYETVKDKYSLKEITKNRVEFLNSLK